MSPRNKEMEKAYKDSEYLIPLYNNEEYIINIDFDGILRWRMNITMMDFCPSRRDIKHCMLSAFRVL